MPDSVHSTCLMEFLINFLNSPESEWPPKDLNSGSANSPSTLGRTKACHSPSSFLYKAKNKPPSPSCDYKMNKKKNQGAKHFVLNLVVNDVGGNDRL